MKYFYFGSPFESIQQQKNRISIRPLANCGIISHIVVIFRYQSTVQIIVIPQYCGKKKFSSRTNILFALLFFSEFHERGGENTRNRPPYTRCASKSISFVARFSTIDSSNPISAPVHRGTTTVVGSNHGFPLRLLALPLPRISSELI